VRRLRFPAAALLALVVCVQGSYAQGPSLSSLPISLFERYLDGLRQQAGIPGLSGALVQGGKVVWERGFGVRQVDGLQPALADTPYPLLDLSQTISSTLLLQQCVEYRYLEVSDRVRRWVSRYPEGETTVGNLLAHTRPGGAFQYDPGRYAVLTEVIEQCTSDRYSPLLAEEILDRLGMSDTVPGQDAPQNPTFFTAAAVTRYVNVLQRVASPHRVDSRGRAARSDYSGNPLTASSGIISTVRDVARFDVALDSGVLVSPPVRNQAWESGSSGPAGWGWFVQNVNGERVIWHFGSARDAYSALYIKVPGRNLSLVLLANSDGLAAPYNLSNGDIRTSLFAQLFFQLFLT
jgi:CubicO group peptidase (beta-lactamase class C family)